MKILGIGLALIVAIVLGFLIVASFQPDEFHVTRSITIDAPPEAVFARVDDLRKFQEFSPWAKRDPSAVITYDGPATGTGASFAWAGNSEVGVGRMTIVESRPSDLIRIRLDFLEPFASVASSEFAFKPDGEQTVVTWSMAGESNLTGKAIGLILNMDQMIGGDFASGLASLKTLCEPES